MNPITPGDYRDIEGNALDAPGTSAFFPGTVVFGTRSQPASYANAIPTALVSYPNVNDIPNPSFEGQPRPERALGFSTGFRRVFSTSAFRGRTLAIPALGPNPRTGHIGLLTRSMRSKVDALTTDYTPNGNSVASDYVDVSG